MNYIYTLIAFCLLWGSEPIWASTPKIKVACVGNSITFGAGISNREKNNYPAQLQAYLGDSYEVTNFGVSGRTLLSKGDLPYIQTEQYKKSLSFNPDIVLIKLGTNDSKPQNRPFLPEFKNDYLKLIESYQNLPSHPRVILLTPVRCFLIEENTINDNVMQKSITPVIKEIAYEKDLDIINLYYLFGNQWQEHIMPDRLHPSSIGAGIMAKKIYEYLAVSRNQQSDVIGKFPLKYTQEFNFHGYKGYKYNHEGVEYYIVKPHKPAKGNPWIWRARFWGHEPQTDISMLEQGFYLTYCDVADLYGSDKAVKRWNIFYKLATKAGLNKKVVLEGMSRGGLIVYNWAARNTSKVACIYADAPVMDITSWPMGKGASEGSLTDSEQMMAAYGFKSQEDALRWKGNPIDHAAVLAKAQIPILHVVGDADVVVPVKENTDVFAKRLSEKGYKLNIIHKPGIGHHPHSLNNPNPIVRFMLESTGRKNNRCIHAVPGNEFRSGAGWTNGSDWHSVAEDIEKTLSGKKIKILMLGNSITQGLGGERKAVTYKPGKTVMDNWLGAGNWETAGISGDRTQNLLWRIKNNNYAICSPEIAIITIGVNNLIGDDDKAEDVAAGIIACAEEAHKQLPNTRIITLGLLPVEKEKGGSIRTRYNEIHRILSKKKFKDIQYIDPTSWFVNADGTIKSGLYGGDYIHLTEKGYQVWCDHLKDVLSK